MSWHCLICGCSKYNDPEFNSSPDSLTALTQFRNFLVNKGTTISDKDVERCNFVKNTTTVKAERHYLSVDGLLWFYLDSFVEYVKDTYNGSISKDGPRSQTEIWSTGSTCLC